MNSTSGKPCPHGHCAAGAAGGAPGRGAAPPGISWVGNVCGQCHSIMADLFAKSVHEKRYKMYDGTTEDLYLTFSPLSR